MTTLQQKPNGGAARRPSASRPSTALRPHVVGAVFRRDFLGYFNNPAGYVFLALFGLVCALAEFYLPVFFANNLANLGPLNDWMPYLLLFFIPAITMSIWAEERRQGTDELLLTLPARDVEVVLGKYLAALGIYTVALLFLVVHVAILMTMGHPDLGVVASTFFGYWLMGAMLIAIGMVASLLSSNATVAFILGGLFAAVPVFADQFASAVTLPRSWLSGAKVGAVAGSTQRLIEELSVPSQFRSFASGVFSLPGVVYFLSWAAGMLYLNMVLLGRRHWAGGAASKGRWAHAVARILAVAAGLVALNVLVGQASSRWDLLATGLLIAGLAAGVALFALRMTVLARPGRDPFKALMRDLALGLLVGLLLNVAIGRGALRLDASEEGLTKLSRESIDLIAKIPQDRPVFIQAYLSPRVPREYVQIRNDLVNKLREFAARGGDRIRLNLIEPERYSAAAREAEKRFGIEPRRVLTNEDGRQGTAEIYLGAAFTSGPEEVVIPFFEPGVPVEYELTRSVRVVSRANRKKVGILATDARLLGGFDMRTMGQSNDWPIVTELRKQYEVSGVSPDTNIPRDLDALLVAQPSSLTQKQIDSLTDYVRKGGPTLLFMDPLPLVDPTLSPEEPRTPPGGGMFGGQQPVEPKGDLGPLLDLLGIEWAGDRVVWNSYNPTRIRELPPEVVVIGRGSGADDAFNPKEPASSGLQEIALLYAGSLSPKASANGLKFTPLLRTNDSGGTVGWAELFPRGLRGMPNPRLNHFPTDRAYTLAARIQGEPKAKGDDKAKAEKGQSGEIKVIAIADLDLISETFFSLRKQVKTEGLDFDDVTFVLNCVDVLAGDEDFIQLRTRRPKFRTLDKIERYTKSIEEKRLDEEKEADQAAKDALEKAQTNLQAKVKDLSARKDLDDRTKDFMVDNLLKAENRRLDNVVKVEIEDEKRRKIQESEAEAREKIRQKQNEARLLALFLPPLLPLLLGAMVFGARAGRENRGASPNRLA